VSSVDQPHPGHSFWRLIYHRRRRHIGRTEQELLGGQLLSLAGGILAGLILEVVKSDLIAVTGVLLLLPGLLELEGSVAGAYSAKIYHEYLASGHFKRSLTRRLVYSLAVVALATIVVGMVGGALGAWLFQGSPSQLLRLALIAAISAAVIGLPVVGLATIWLIRRGHNPDNIIGPVETSLFDGLTVLAIYAAIKWLGVV
jgi:cation transporter-like permease